MQFLKDDGGRSEAGYKGDAGDCVCRAIAIATGKPYAEIYAALAESTGDERQTKRSRTKGRTARNGIHTKRKWFHEYMTGLGFVWVATMAIGTGCKVHLRDGELPDGRLVVSVSKHMVAVIDGVIHDTFDPSRYGTRCVYGYYRLKMGKFQP